MNALRSLACLAAAACSTAALAGPLTPPGPPASTMKTIQQAEPRTPIGQADIPLTINRAGSYYLTENLFPAGLGDPFVIEVIADDVTLDLRGFTIYGATEVTTAQYGVHIVNGVQNVVVHNGTISRCVSSGVEAIFADGVAIESLRLTSNGADGARLGSRSRIDGCVAYANGSDGFTILGAGGVIVNTVAEANGNDGIDSGASTSIENCTADTNGRFGFLVAAGSTATNCTAVENGEDGFFTVGGSVLTGCAAYRNKQSGYRSNERATFIECSAISNDLHGFELSDAATVLNCSSNSNAVAGYSLGETTNNCRIEGNTATGNDTGFQIFGSANVVIRNSAGANTTNEFVIAGGNVAGPFVTAANVAVNTNPGANYVH